jgi:hypothetical protein
MVDSNSRSTAGQLIKETIDDYKHDITLLQNKLNGLGEVSICFLATMVYNRVIQGGDMKLMLAKISKDIQEEVAYMADSPHTTECVVKVKPPTEDA